MRKNSPTRVSAVICTFNGERFLTQQLESMLDQSRSLNEVVVSDDGSTDSTNLIIADFIERHSGPQYPVWKVFRRQDPLGVSANFEFALGQASGEIVFFADQDDLWETDKVRCVVEQFLDENVLLIHTDATLIASDGQHMGSLMQTLGLTIFERKHLLSGETLRVLLRRNVVTGATVAIRSSLLSLALPIPKGWIHDEWVALVAASRSGAVFDSRMLIRYRQHEANEIGVRRIDFRRISERLREKRSSIIGRRLERDSGIESFLQKNSKLLGESSLILLRGKIEFDRWRGNLSVSRLGRLFPVIRRTLRGDYSSFARGYLDVARDLLMRH